MFDILNSSFAVVVMFDWTLFIVRIIMGVIMIYYGWPKIKNLKSNAGDFVKMGFKPGMFWGTIIAFVEFFGGILVIAGFYTAIVALLFGVEMILGTIWKIVKAKKPFTDYSYDILLLALALIILTFGAGSIVAF